MDTELKRRKRSLMAWMTVFSLLLGTGFMHTVARAETAVPDVLLTVSYNLDGMALSTQSHQRYYIDETAGTMEESVSVKTLSESEVQLSEGQLLLAWQMADSTGATSVILPGESVTLNWADLLGESAQTATVNMEALVQEYSICEKYVGTDDNTYFISNMDNIGDITINRGENSYTVTAPGKPEMNAHEFLYWKLCKNSSIIGTAAPGKEFSLSGEINEYDYSVQDTWSIEAEWASKATINFYKSVDDIDVAVYQSISITERDATGATLPFSFTMPAAPSSDDGSTFLTWNSYMDDTYSLPNASISYDTWPTLSSGFVGTVVATWLTPMYEFGDPLVEDWQGTISVSCAEDSFTIMAPETVPTASGYEFTGWTVLINNTSYEVGAGKVITGEDGTAMLFPYSDYAGQTICVTAQWVKLPTVTVSYYSDATEANLVYEEEFEVTDTTSSIDIRSPKVTELTDVDESLFVWEIIVGDSSKYVATGNSEPFSVSTLAANNYAAKAYAHYVTFEVATGGAPSDNVLSEARIGGGGNNNVLLYFPEISWDGYVLTGWELNNGSTSETYDAETFVSVPATFLADSTVTLTAQWEEAEPTEVSSGSAELKQGQKYRFPEGQWVIEGDTTVYEGGVVFYVPSSGVYNISEGGE